KLRFKRRFAWRSRAAQQAPWTEGAPGFMRGTRRSPRAPGPGHPSLFRAVRFSRLSGVCLMNHPGFFHKAGPFPLAEVAAATGAEVQGDANAAARSVGGVEPLSEAGPDQLSFFENRKY